jgi:nucleotide-binding universal stress UspA family protein
MVSLICIKSAVRTPRNLVSGSWPARRPLPDVGAQSVQQQGAIMFKHILIPTDGSPVAAKAVKAGVALAKDMGARITGYYALEALPQVFYGDSYIVDQRMVAEYERAARETGAKYLRKIEAAAEKAGVAFAPLMSKAAAPYIGIVEAAKKRKCDVIVISSHGRGGVAGLVLGSVTQKVLSHSKIPVLVYR